MSVTCGFAFNSSLPRGTFCPLTASFGEKPGRKCWAQAGDWRHCTRTLHRQCESWLSATFSTGNEAQSKLRPLCFSAQQVRKEDRPSRKNNYLDKPSTNMLINSPSSCHCSILIAFPWVITMKNSLSVFGKKIAIAFQLLEISKWGRSFTGKMLTGNKLRKWSPEAF